MSTVQQAIEVSAPVNTVYERFATFESYPQFMTGVEQVIQTSSNETHWIMDLDGQRREFDAQITECSLNQRVSWSALDGPLLAETITLRPLGETRTQIVAQLEADIAGLMPSDRHGQESLNRRLKADLASFKLLIEGAGSGTADTGPSGTSMSGSGYGKPGSPGSASPPELAARLNRHRATGEAERGPAMGAATNAGARHVAEDAALRDMLPPGTHIGDAEMGSQVMTADDVWGDGMINEEERGGTHGR